MKFLVNELNKFVNISNKSNKELVDIFTSLAYEVEEHYPANIIEGVRLAKVIECGKHPDSDKLSFLKTEIDGEIVEVVCGAPNIRAGLVVAHAVPGSRVGNMTLEPKELRGVVSNGMITSISEISGINKEIIDDANAGNIYEFDLETDLSLNPAQVLGLDTEVFDLSILPDRQYGASYASMAREISAYTNEEFKFDIKDVERTGETNVSIELGDKATSVYATNVVVKESKTPQSIKNVLYFAGIKPLDTIEDMFAYASLITGASTYLVDRTSNIKLDGRTLNGLDIFNASSINTNNNEAMLITISSNAHGNIVKEENMNPVFGLRNIKSTTTEAANLTSKYVLQLLEENGYLVSASETTSQEVDLSKTIELSDDYLFGYIGQEFDLEPIIKQLSVLGITREGDNYFIPSYRKDIEFKQDVIEEISRLFGIENITPKSHELTKDDVTNEAHKNALVNITGELTKYGLYEVKTYQLVTEEQAKEFNIWNHDKFVKLNDEYTLEYNTLQPSLVSGLIDSFKLNHRNEKEDIRLFEISNVFHNEKPVYSLGILHDELINEEEPILATKELTLKALESIGINPNEVTFESNNQIDIFNPFISSNIIYNKNTIGVIGEIHPSILRKNKFIRLDKVKAKLYYSEILLERVI